MTESGSVLRVLTEAFIDQFPQEALPVLEQAPVSEVVQLLEAQSTERAILILTRLSSALASEVFTLINPEAGRRILTAMDPGRAALLLSNLDDPHRESLLNVLEAEMAGELRDLMSYPQDSAGHLMQPRVATIAADSSVQQALRRLRRFSARDAALPVVTDGAGKLAGLVDLAELVRADPAQRVGELIKDIPISVGALAPRDEIVELFSRYRLRLLPVVDLDGHLQGIIRQNRVIQAAQEEALTNIQAMVGVSRDERALSTPLVAMRKRLPWLNINLLTAFLAAAVVGIFEDTIAQFTALAVLLPVVAGQSGNTGAQALAVIMRGLALREIRIRHWRRVLFKELLVGCINGVAIAVVTSLGVLVWSHSWGLAAVIGLAMVVSMALASLSGAAIPLVLTRVGQDPAQSASIILTTVTDVVGFLSFLGLATVFSRLL